MMQHLEHHASDATASHGRLRSATLLDTPELARLLRTTGYVHTGHAALAPYDLLEHGHLLVLELTGKIAAAIHVRVAHDHATVDALLIDPALYGPEHERQIEDRMISVAHAFCEAYGYALPSQLAISQRRVRGRR